eukprot:563529-Heterocapsa_arctica.AAC.1
MARHSCGGLDCQSNVRFHGRSWLGHFLRADETLARFSCGGLNSQSKFRPHGRSRLANLLRTDGYVRCTLEHGNERK